MIHELAYAIIQKSFELCHKEVEFHNEDTHLIDEDYNLDIQKAKEMLGLSDSDIEIVGYVDKTEGEQQDERDFAEEIINRVEEGMNLISLTVFFENDSPYQEYFRYLLVEKL